MWMIIFLINLLDALNILPWLLSWFGGVEIGRVWETWQPATCMPDHCFCEPVAGGFIRQPVNTWSNLAFVLAGGLAVGGAIRTFSRQPAGRGNVGPMQSQWIYSAVYGLATILIGFGSMFYHASLTFYGQVADILSMYLLSIFMALYNLSRLRKMGNGTFFTVYLAANVILGYFSIIWPESRRHIFIGIVVVVLITELILRRRQSSRIDTRLMAAAVGSLLVGSGVWLLDVTGVVCLSGSWLQLHSLWHIAIAAAIWFLYLYYRSERLEFKNHQVGEIGQLLEAG